MAAKKSARSKAALKGWETRRANERKAKRKSSKRSKAAKLGWETRRSNEKKRSKSPVEWYVQYQVSGTGGKQGRIKRDFHGELIFSTKKKITPKQATKTAAQILKGETPKGVDFKHFSYHHGKVSRQRIIDDIDDMPDFDFLVHDNDSSYVSSTGENG